MFSKQKAALLAFNISSFSHKAKANHQLFMHDLASQVLYAFMGFSVTASVFSDTSSSPVEVTIHMLARLDVYVATVITRVPADGSGKVFGHHRKSYSDKCL